MGKKQVSVLRELNLEKKVRAFPAGTNKTVRNNEVQVVSNR